MADKIFLTPITFPFLPFGAEQAKDRSNPTLASGESKLPLTFGESVSYLQKPSIKKIHFLPCEFTANII